MMFIILVFRGGAGKIFCYQPFFILHLQQEIERWKGTGSFPSVFNRHEHGSANCKTGIPRKRGP